MAYLTFDPSSLELENLLEEVRSQIELSLQTRLPKLGVAEDDVVLKIQKCNTVSASKPHIEIILKTDNNRVTAPRIVEILHPILKAPFEVTRIYVGYWIVELFYELAAFIRRNERNWASNYDS